MVLCSGNPRKVIVRFFKIHNDQSGRDTNQSKECVMVDTANLIEAKIS